MTWKSWLTLARVSSSRDLVSLVAKALERSLTIHAPAVAADAGDFSTFIAILKEMSESQSMQNTTAQ